MTTPPPITLPDPLDLVVRLLAQAQGVKPLELLLRLVKDEAKRTMPELEDFVASEIDLFRTEP